MYFVFAYGRCLWALLVGVARGRLVQRRAAGRRGFGRSLAGEIEVTRSFEGPFEGLLVKRPV